MIVTHMIKKTSPAVSTNNEAQLKFVLPIGSPYCSVPRLPIDSRSTREDFQIAKNLYHWQFRETKRTTSTTRTQRQMNRIDILPDEVLLEIFDCNMHSKLEFGAKQETEEWISLVHVCRRWRGLVLASPRRLNLQLYCTHNTDTLDVWPALPLVVRGYTSSSLGPNNITAVLEQSHRVCKVDILGLAGGEMEEVLAVMQVPFPELTDLWLKSFGTLPVIPDSFLDGSAPRLRNLRLNNIPFPGLPNLLLSSPHLVSLKLINVPRSGYIPPEAIVALLSALPNLETLSLEFKPPRSLPNRETRHRSKRLVIPALTSLNYTGTVDYLEDLVTDIDTPQLDDMRTNFPHQISFNTPRLAQFINRTPKLRNRDAIQ